MIDEEDECGYNEYDQHDSHNEDQAFSKNGQKQKLKKKINNLNGSFDSQNSDIRIGNGKSRRNDRQDQIEEDADEEEAILKRELGGDMSEEMDSEYGDI